MSIFCKKISKYYFKYIRNVYLIAENSDRNLFINCDIRTFMCAYLATNYKTMM